VTIKEYDTTYAEYPGENTQQHKLQKIIQFYLMTNKVFLLKFNFITESFDFMKIKKEN